MDNSDKLVNVVHVYTKSLAVFWWNLAPCLLDEAYRVKIQNGNIWKPLDDSNHTFMFIDQTLYTSRMEG